MDNQQLGQLILYLVHKVADLGGYTTTIRLVKFLYLIDLEHQRRLGRTLTGLQWKYHLYGPYAFELPSVGRRLGFDLEHEEFVNARGHKGTLLRVSTLQSFPPSLSYSVQVIVDGLLKVWGDQDTSDLLRYVYCTEPMRQARRGEALDFSVVPLGTHYYELHIPTDKSVVRQLRESLRSYAVEDSKEYERPETVHDEALDEGLRALDDSEALTMPDLSGVFPQVDANSLLDISPEVD
jgi:hypothetical protein